jgi:hypothetical protein
VHDSTNSAKAQLAPVVSDAKSGYRSLSRLRPLAAAHGRRQVASVLNVPQLAYISSIPGTWFALKERADGARARHDGGHLGVGVINADIVRGG